MSGTNQEIESSNNTVAVSSVYNSYNIDSSVTGTTTETVLVNLKVTGGDMGPNGVLYIESELAKIGGAAGGTLRMYTSTVGTNSIGNTGVPASSTLIGSYNISASPLNPQPFSRKIVNKNNAALNYIFNTTQVSTNMYLATSNNARTLLNQNTANDFWIVITAALASAADTFIVQNTQIYLRKP